MNDIEGKHFFQIIKMHTFYDFFILINYEDPTAGLAYQNFSNSNNMAY